MTSSLPFMTSPWWPNWGSPLPARVAIQVTALPKGAKVEIELVALLR
jgi:enamine deaminase RidA (YjgF/YER057c/UK114 family)